MQNPQITLYTRLACPYCTFAVALLKSKNVKFKEIDAGFNQKLKDEMIKKAGGRKTFPQIFIGDQHIGGFDEMKALDKANALDKLLFPK